MISEQGERSAARKMKLKKGRKMGRIKMKGKERREGRDEGKNKALC